MALARRILESGVANALSGVHAALHKELAGKTLLMEP
jgi:hypothetical protein